ncbi:hypothetical protein [Tenacibaculum dicentrarchi]|uniref:hypothetical protein n=1 Tax=Tenacibaculum dicentrarchi TaxID=669041 RepID=UPI003519CD08
MLKNNILFGIILMLFFTSCNSQNLDDEIIIIIQPKLEINTTNSIKILFKNLKRTDSIFIEKVDGLEFNDNPSKHIREINGNNYLEYYTYTTSTQTGKIKLPIIKGISDSITLTSKPRTIEVVKKLAKTTKDDIILKLISNKEIYKKTDTISIVLYEYSKYYNVSKKTQKKDSIQSLPKIKGQGNTISIETESDMYKISGNEKLEDYIDENFNVVDFDWDPFRSGTIMESLNNELYLKTLLISIKVTPKHKGKFEIEPSRLMYFPHKSETDYYDSFEPNEKGTYTVLPPKNKILIISNELKFKVK